MPPTINYQDKTVVVTGAATVVGTALLEKLHAAGAERIIAVDIRPCSGPVDEFVLADLSHPSSIDDAVWQLPERIDVLITNTQVAITPEVPVVMSLNVLAPRKLISVLQHRMPPGSAIAMTASTGSSRVGELFAPIRQLLAIDDWWRALDWVHDHPHLTHNCYDFAGECAQAMTALYAPQLTKRGIRLNAVCPTHVVGPPRSDFEASAVEPIRDWMTTTVYKATPTQIADALAFLGCDAALSINGANLIVDNGVNSAIVPNGIDYTRNPRRRRNAQQRRPGAQSSSTRSCSARPACG